MIRQKWKIKLRKIKIDWILFQMLKFTTGIVQTISIKVFKINKLIFRENWNDLQMHEKNCKFVSLKMWAPQNDNENLT